MPHKPGDQSWRKWWDSLTDEQRRTVRDRKNAKERERYRNDPEFRLSKKRQALERRKKQPTTNE